MHFDLFVDGFLIKRVDYYYFLEKIVLKGVVVVSFHKFYVEGSTVSRIRTRSEWWKCGVGSGQ